MDLIDLAERAILPDWLIRMGMRLMANRLRDVECGDAEEQRERLRQFLSQLRRSPIAIETDVANRQHYEVPAAFFERVLGPRLKYSCCYWPTLHTTLSEAEEAMLDLFCRRAGIADGMQILELGCGWGSLCLWIAEKHLRAASWPCPTRGRSASSSSPAVPQGVCRMSKSLRRTWLISPRPGGSTGSFRWKCSSICVIMLSCCGGSPAG